MPALNSRLHLPTSSRNEQESFGDQFKKHITFTNVFAAVMAGLSLKERWDDYQDRREERERRRIVNSIIGNPNEPTDPANRVANPNPEAAASSLATAPPPYRDNPSQENINISAPNDPEAVSLLGPDATPIRPRNRNRSRSCCVCCGVRCDLVFKALGIAIALYLGYGLFRLVQWARTPSPTGLEDMPEYSASLGCLNVPYIYGGDSENIYSFPVSNPDGSSSSVSINLSGGAVGTLLVAQGDEDDVQIEMDLRTNEEPLLDKVVLLVENTEDISRKQFKLSTPASATSEDACMRYDIIVRVPSDLKELEITSKAISHVKFDERSSLSLESLSINLQSAFPSNLLLPTSEIHAISTSLEMRGGYLVGSAAILNQTMIKTSRGSAISNIHFFSEPYGFPSTPATLKTDTGSGRSDFWYANPEKRPIRSEHIASSAGDLYLTYREARYEGKLDVKSKSMSSTGIEGMMGARPGAGGGTGEKTDPWVGDEQGGDKLKVRSQGWVGLYF